jgi:hypothetical protein
MLEIINFLTLEVVALIHISNFLAIMIVGEILQAYSLIEINVQSKVCYLH